MKLRCRYEVFSYESRENWKLIRIVIRNYTKSELIKVRFLHPDFWAHFIPGALYVTLSTLMVLIAIYY